MLRRCHIVWRQQIGRRGQSASGIRKHCTVDCIASQQKSAQNRNQELMARRNYLASSLSVLPTVSLLVSGCGGISGLETDPLLLPANVGGAGSTEGVANGGSPGGAASTQVTTTYLSGGTSLGGKSAYTGGRAASTSTAVQAGEIGIGGRGQGGTGGSSLGGRSALGGSGGYITSVGGQTPVASCPDDLSYQEVPLPINRTLGNYADHYQPSCRAALGAPDFTYAWYASVPGTYVIDTLGSETDTVLAAYDGLCGNTELGCNDDDAYGTSRQSRIVLDIVEPHFVTIVVDSYAGESGSFQLRINQAWTLVNVVLPSVVPVSVLASTAGLPDHSTSTCNGKISSSDYTYLYRAPTTGTYQFLAESSGFDPVLTLRESGPAGRELACNDDFTGANPSVTYALYEGQLIALVIDGFDGSSGTFRLSVTLSPNDSGSCCSSSTTRVGCVDPNTARCVCASRSACCRTAWDSTCAAAVSTLGCGSCGL